MKMQNSKKQLNTPILFLTFNRPDLTQRVFDEIKKAQPKQLFWVSDGARNEEKKLVQKTREIIKQIDWNCEVKTNFSDKNLGCKIRVSSGIDWFFENVEQGIILEDDCLPSQSFFPFCEELLDKYKNDKNVMMISGDNFQFGKNKIHYDYYFSQKYFHIWGWATWRRAWNKYDVKMSDWEENKKSNIFKKLFTNKVEREKILTPLENTYQGLINTWDYQWLYTCLKNKGLSIIPNENLMSNIGFDKRGTHTRSTQSIMANISRGKIYPPIKHPLSFILNPKADDFTFWINNNNVTTTFGKIKNKLNYLIRNKGVKYIKKISKITDSFLGTSFFAKIHNKQIGFHNNKYSFNNKEYSFIHIPKTGGTTISETLKKQIGIKFVNLNAHQPISIYLKPNEDNKYITFLRNPVERVWSYYQMASKMSSNPHHIHTKRGLKFFIKHCWEVRDMACQYISGEIDKTVTEEILNKAKNNLKNFFFVGDFKNIESDLKKLIELTGGNQIEIPHLQKNKKSLLTDNDKKLILKYNKNDEELYNWFKTIKNKNEL